MELWLLVAMEYISHHAICEKCSVNRHGSCNIVKTKTLFHVDQFDDKLHLLIKNIDEG